jgi:hypothetical protein
MNKAKQIIFLIFILVSCRGEDKGLKLEAVINQFASDSLQREKQRYAIINDTNRFDLDSRGGKAFWTPNQNHLKTIFTITKETITKNQDKYSKHLKSDSLANAYKQIVCYVDNKGDSLVYINAICQILDYPAMDSTGRLRYYRQDWQNKIIIPKDGGDCYWRILINFSKKKSEGLYANGEA